MTNYLITKRLILIFILILSVQLIVYSDDTQVGQRTVLTAHQTNELISLDGVADEPAWSLPDPLVVKVQDGSIGTVNVTLKALYDQQYLYLLVAWSDPTESISKDEWTWEGEKWTVSGEDDGLAFFWNIDDSIAGFNIAGCAMLCHGDRMHTNARGEVGDLWYWKAGRTNPVGYADDKWIDDTIVGGYSHTAKEAALRSDSAESIIETISGGYATNINDKGDAPLYIKLLGNDNKFLLWDEVSKGKAVKITNQTFEKGFAAPGYILRRPTGSKGDIDASGRWKDGRWTIEQRRKLQTSHPDDVQFDVSRTYRFGIAVMDNVGGFQAFGIGHSFDLGARTLEFGGLMKESITKLTLVKDYLTIGESHIRKGELGLAYSSIDDALILFNEISDEVSEVDPALYLETKRRFSVAKRSPNTDEISILSGHVDLAILTLQGKRMPASIPWDVTLLLYWGKIQVYTLILLAALAVFPIIRVMQVGRKPTFRRLSIFLFIVIVPLVFEGVGRVGMLAKNPALESFSFLTNEYATLLWAWLMLIGIFIAREGFGEVESSIQSLEYYSTQLEEDIQQRKKLEDKLRRSEEKYRGLFEHSIDGVADISPDGILITYNESTANMLDLKKDDFARLTLTDLAFDASEINQAISKLGKDGYLKDQILNLKGKNGEKVIVSVSGRRIDDENGKHVRSEVIFRDVTERVRTEEERQALRQQLDQTERLASIGKLAAGVAHEINNPLTNIMLASEKLSKLELTDEVKKRLDLIKKNVETAGGIARNLLTFSRKTTPDLEEVDIVRIINSTLELFTFRMKNIKLSVDLKDIPMVYADPNQMQQVFTNILVNAIQAMPEGGELKIYGDTKDGYLRLFFEDTGAGIAEEHLDRIFDPFYTTKVIGSGTGLGLSISYGIVKAHEGEIKIESKVGKGTKVIVSLPLTKKNKVNKEEDTI